MSSKVVWTQAEVGALWDGTLPFVAGNGPDNPGSDRSNCMPPTRGA